MKKTLTVVFKKKEEKRVKEKEERNLSKCEKLCKNIDLNLKIK